MTNARIEVAIGELSFSGEGDQEWLAGQLDKILEAVPRLREVATNREQPKGDGSTQTNTSGDTEEFTATLASHIKKHGGESNQVQRFLATADWLRRRGETKLTTGAVTKALRDNHQKKLSNPADCLNKNVSKGFCEKTGDSFFITPDGLKALGKAA
jgi:hypothetical protein